MDGHRIFYNAQKSWIAGFEIGYSSEELCLFAKKYVEKTTSERNTAVEKNEAAHTGPNWDTWTDPAKDLP